MEGWVVAPESAMASSLPSVILMHAVVWRAKSLLLKFERDVVEVVAPLQWDLCLAEAQLLVIMVASSSSWTGYGELLLTVGVGR